MEKNRMMRLASALLILTLLTTCMISGTFAKYTTKAEGSDTARVAKWGVTVTANGSTFATEYNTDDGMVSGTIAKSVVAATSASGTQDNLVAPGTKGEMTKMALSGTPEVAVKVSYVGQFDISDNWKVNGIFYCPLVIKVKSETGTTEIKGLTYTTATDFENAVNNAIADYSTNYDANTNLSSKSDDFLSVEWEWPFSITNDDNTTNDEKDTFLGGQAASNNPATVTLTVTTTVTQID
ncbi:hypothetical protein [Frisingicoccus sp.]|uniref:hypothetical protein n=1 Tax=Frisingicoccus sp. TaxID=1918627 RepID=UPI003AB22CEA